MIIEIDDASKEPPYAQISAAIALAIAGGELTKGAVLPTIRQLAGDLGLANNTVARAYRELESEGLVLSRGRRGTIVTGLEPAGDPAARRLVANFVEEARALGLDAQTTLGLLTTELAK